MYTVFAIISFLIIASVIIISVIVAAYGIVIIARHTVIVEVTVRVYMVNAVIPSAIISINRAIEIIPVKEVPVLYAIQNV